MPSPRFPFRIPTFGTALAAILACAILSPAARAATTTLVLIRHGEKPDRGLGQLDCRGLNRALALPAVIGKMFGRPDAAFAPDPGQSHEDGGVPYSYIRPLATIEPTAIAFGLPVDASIGVTDIQALAQKLELPEYDGKLLLVAWEHHYLVSLARLLMTRHGGQASSIPDWKGEDFDSVYVIRMPHAGTGAAASFERRGEGLDGRPASCP